MFGNAFKLSKIFCDELIRKIKLLKRIEENVVIDRLVNVSHFLIYFLIIAKIDDIKNNYRINQIRMNMQ